jgi:hypothetical protein
VSTSLLSDPEVLSKLQTLKIEKMFIVSEWFMKVSALKRSRPPGVVHLSMFNVLNLVIILVIFALIVVVTCWCVVCYLLYSYGVFDTFWLVVFGERVSEKVNFALSKLISEE